MQSSRWWHFLLPWRRRLALPPGPERDQLPPPAAGTEVVGVPTGETLPSEEPTAEPPTSVPPAGEVVIELSKVSEAAAEPGQQTAEYAMSPETGRAREEPEQTAELESGVRPGTEEWPPPTQRPPELQQPAVMLGHPTGHQGELEEAGATGVLGPAAVHFQGPWDGNTTYALHDTVTRNGPAWISLVEGNLGNDPLTDAGVHWLELAAPGGTGAIGPTGDLGPSGREEPERAQERHGSIGTEGQQDAPEESPGVAPPPAAPTAGAAANAEARLIARGNYFAPANYAPGAPSLLAPDLAWQLGRSARPLLPPAGVPKTAPRPESRSSRPMEFFATAATRRTAGTRRPGVVTSVDPILLSAFLADRESGPQVPPQATHDYLSEPTLAALGIQLRDQVVRNWTSGRPPLRTRAFYEMAAGLAGHSGTALLLCHNVAKALARGGTVIPWRTVNRSQGEYSDGAGTYTAAVRHPAGMLKPVGFSHPTIFYVLFSAEEFGTHDLGDWYHYFTAATVAAYASGGEVAPPLDPPTADVEDLARLITEIAQQMGDASISPAAQYHAWLWANALSFLEGSRYGRSQAKVAAASRIDLRGAGFGVSQAGNTVDSAWRWYVPLAGGLGIGKQKQEVNLASGTSEVLAPTDAGLSG